MFPNSESQINLFEQRRWNSVVPPSAANITGSMREFSKIYIYLRPWEIALVRYDVPLPWPKPCRSITMASTSPITLEYFHFNFLVAVIPCSFAKLGQKFKNNCGIHSSQKCFLLLRSNIAQFSLYLHLSNVGFLDDKNTPSLSAYVTTPCQRGAYDGHIVGKSPLGMKSFGFVLHRKPSLDPKFSCT